MTRYCEPCNKEFLTNAKYVAHCKTKRHREIVDLVMNTFCVLALEEMRRLFGEEAIEELRKYCLALPQLPAAARYDVPTGMWGNALTNVARISADLVKSTGQ